MTTASITAETAQGMVVASGEAPDWAIHLANNQWTWSPLLWGYLVGAVVLIALCRWLTRRWRPVLQAVARGGWMAWLLSPAVLACGAISIMPFPVLLWNAWRSTDAVSCGAPLVALPPNAMTFAGLWLVLFLTFWTWGWFRKSTSTPPAQ